jgi:serine/threonine-protein kinase RsbT
VENEVSVKIGSDSDIVVARQKGRELATKLGFSSLDLTIIATAISELARNIVLYARRGEIILSPINNGKKCGISVVARDEGPGIPDLRQAMEDGFSTSGSLGLGLSGVKRLMDDFEIHSQIGRGTAVAVKKWIP